MSSLYWSRRVLYLPDRPSGAGRTLVAHKSDLQSRLIAHKFQNVRINNLEVAGGYDDCWFSIGHFFIYTDPTTARGERYWELVMCACSNFDKAKAVVNYVSMLSQSINHETSL